jgi:hypothetical protein
VTKWKEIRVPRSRPASGLKLLKNSNVLALQGAQHQLRRPEAL